MKNRGAVVMMNNWKNSMKLIVLFAVFVLLPVFSFLPASAQDSRDFTVSGGSEGTDWTYTNGVLTFKKGGPYTIGMADDVTMTDHRIEIDLKGVNEDDAHEKTITLKINKLNIKRESGNVVSFINNNQKQIYLNLNLTGENKITNNSSSQNLINYSNTVNTTVNGNGSLELTSSNVNDEWTSNKFTLNAENGKLTLNSVAITANEGIFIQAGELNVTSSESCLYTPTEFLMTGGKLNATATGNNPCIQVTSLNPAIHGSGLQISGGDVNLKVQTSNAPINTGVMLVLFNNNKNKKNILINTSGTVVIDGQAKRAAGILFLNTNDLKSYDADLIMNNGRLYIINSSRGIMRSQTNSYLYFNGGETEIHSGNYALDVISRSYVQFSNDYQHKNYQKGSLSETWNEVTGDLVSTDGKTAKHILITPVNKITYDLDKGLLPSGKSNPADYIRFDLPFTLYNPIRYNSEFLGWTGSNGTTPEKNVIIQTIGDKEYTANWKQIAAGVSISAGAGMSKTDDSGQAAQVLQENVPMTDVVYTADDGYYFPEDYAPVVPSGSGVTVTRNGLGQITVSGPRSLTADVRVILPAATEKQKTTAEFSASGADSGTLSGVKPGMQYSLDGGNTRTDISAESVFIPSGVTTENGILVRDNGQGTVTLVVNPQFIEITRAEKPIGIKSADCTTPANNDGKLIGVTDDMEYRKSGETDWIPVSTGGEVTDLVPGTYQVRVRAKGTALSSDPVEVTVNPFSAPDQVPALVFSHPSGTYEGTQFVTIFCAEEGAVIHYTTDGTDPAADSPVYTEAIPVMYDTVIKAFAVKDGMIDSPVTEAVYTILFGKQIHSDISFSSTYDGEPHGVVISVTDPAEGAVIRYGTSEGTYDLEESPTITDAGSLKVYYQVTAEGYEPLTGSVTLTVAEAPSGPTQCNPPCIP